MILSSYYWKGNESCFHYFLASSYVHFPWPVSYSLPQNLWPQCTANLRCSLPVLEHTLRSLWASVPADPCPWATPSSLTSLPWNLLWMPLLLQGILKVPRKVSPVATVTHPSYHDESGLLFCHLSQAIAIPCLQVCLPTLGELSPRSLNCINVFSTLACSKRSARPAGTCLTNICWIS